MNQQSGTSSLPIALVTGSSSGIGKAIALRLGSDGYHVLAHYNRNVPGAEDAVTRIREAGGSAETLPFDVKDPSAIERALDGYFGGGASTNPAPPKPISVLVNNAGIRQDGLAGLMTDEAFDSVMKTNVYGPFYLLRWCIRRMIRQRAGCIVNISSLAGQTGNAGQINYAASKAALIAMTKSLAMEAGSRGIRVNAVAPGLIETEMLEDLPKEHLEALKKRIPLGRLGYSEEVAGAVAFLCSKDASYITGHTLSVNGGLLPT
jgi:3-oxoacyl-[acyl-carrier protein] reductase